MPRAPSAESRPQSSRWVSAHAESIQALISALLAVSLGFAVWSSAARAETAPANTVEIASAAPAGRPVPGLLVMGAPYLDGPAYHDEIVGHR